jgi:hypothetical protein
VGTLRFEAAERGRDDDCPLDVEDVVDHCGGPPVHALQSAAVRGRHELGDRRPS